MYTLCSIKYVSFNTFLWTLGNRGKIILKQKITRYVTYQRTFYYYALMPAIHGLTLNLRVIRKKMFVYKLNHKRYEQNFLLQMFIKALRQDSHSFCYFYDTFIVDNNYCCTGKTCKTFEFTEFESQRSRYDELSVHWKPKHRYPTRTFNRGAFRISRISYRYLLNGRNAFWLIITFLKTRKNYIRPIPRIQCITNFKDSLRRKPYRRND